MGCLKRIIGFIIFVFAIIGFCSVGGFEMLMKEVDKFINPPENITIERAATIADFSKIPEKYEITKAYDVLGFKAMFVEVAKSNQEIIILDTKNTVKIKSDDIKNPETALKIEKLLANPLSPIEVKNPENFTTSNILVNGKEVPYMQLNGNLKALPFKKLTIIAVAIDDSENPLIVISYDDKAKFQKQIAEDFLNNMKLK